MSNCRFGRGRAVRVASRSSKRSTQRRVGWQAELFVDIRIVRPDGTACEPNETGELLVSGPNVMAGYWDRADATGDAFRKGSYDPIVEACLPLACR